MKYTKLRCDGGDCYRLSLRLINKYYFVDMLDRFDPAPAWDTEPEFEELIS